LNIPCTASLRLEGGFHGLAEAGPDLVAVAEQAIHDGAARDFSPPPFRASLWMFGFYVADRIATGIFKGHTGRSIHGFTPLDEKVRTFISRRNVNLAFFTVALLLDWALPGLRAAEFTFYFIVLWQAACFVWHAERVVQFWNARAVPAS
jgi:hypothetical protein